MKNNDRLSVPGAHLVISVAPALLLLLASSHFLVDTMAGMVTPLWPEMERQLALDTGSILWIYVLWNVTTSFSQLLFGYLGDRHRSRWLIWVGPAVAVVSMSSIGLARSSLELAVVLVIGGLGVAAFHPEAAAMAGASAPSRRSRAMSIFAIGGYLGQAAGPSYSGRLTDMLTLSGLAWGMVWALPAALFLAVGLRRFSASLVTPPAPEPAAGRMLPGPSAAIFFILTIQTLRVIPAMGVQLALAYLLAERMVSNSEIGLVQTAFMAGIGAGGLACALTVRQDSERRVLVWLPLCVAPVLLVVPYVHGVLLLASVGLCGTLIGVALPVLISYGQQLIPDGQRLASSLTLGVSWGLGGAVVAGTMGILGASKQVEAAFVVFAGASVLAGVMALWLPQLPGPAGSARGRD